MCVHGTALHGRLCAPHKTHQGHVCLHASERSFAQRKQRWLPGWQVGHGRPQSCAAASRSAEQKYSRADLAKQMLAFGLPTLSISLADPAMSLVDTVIIGALFSAWPACMMRREALPLTPITRRPVRIHAGACGAGPKRGGFQLFPVCVLLWSFHLNNQARAYVACSKLSLPCASILYTVWSQVGIQSAAHFRVLHF